MNETTKLLPGTKTFTLLLWEEIPERTLLVLIPTERYAEDTLADLQVAHGHHLNEPTTTPAQAAAIGRLSDRVHGRGPHHESFADYVADAGILGWLGPPIEEKIITRVYRTGIFI